MLSISSSPPVVWSSAPAPAVAPVSAAVAVAPVQSAQRDAQAGTGSSGRDPAAAARGVAPTPERAAEREAKASPSPEAAPLLPRPQSDDAQDGQAPTPELQNAQAEAEYEQQQAREAQEKALKEQLQDVIANVWKASAAVVERALGRDDELPAAASGVDGAAASAVVAAAPAVTGADAALPGLPGARAQAANDEAVAELADLRAGQEVVAYDAQGHSSLAPLEAGSLISRRV